MTEEILSLRALNRAVLARQLLLRRASLSAWNALEWLGGLQAQSPDAPYIGLWSRLEHFTIEDLSNSIEERRAVRAPLMRDTLHLTTAADFRMWRPALQPAMERVHARHCGDIDSRVDISALVETARGILAEEPRTVPELQGALSVLYPEEAATSLAYTVRTFLPLVQVPPAGLWQVHAPPAYAVAEDWLGPSQMPGAESLRHLVVRYLGAFGPASLEDVETWAGMPLLGRVLDELSPALVTFRDDTGRTLYDLPEAPRPGGEVEAPPRFLPAHDGLMLSYADPRRLLPEPDKSRVLLPAGRVKATFLVDGFVQGTWHLRRGRSGVTLYAEPFIPLGSADRDALEAEGERLLRFLGAEGDDLSGRVIFN